MRNLRIEVGIDRLYVQFEPLRARRDLPADVAEADDAERLAGDARDRAAIRVQLGGMPPPASLAHVLVHAHELARDRDQKADRLLGDFDRVTARRVADLDAELVRGLEVHAVDADAGAADDLAALELRNDLARERHGAVHDDTVGVAAGLGDLRLAPRVAD